MQEYCIRYWSILLKNANWCLVAGGDELIILTNYLYYYGNTAASAPRSDFCNCKIEFIFSILSLQKYFIYEIFDAERFIAVAFSRSLPLSKYLCINLRSYSKKIFSRCIFSTLSDSFSFCMHSMRCTVIL